MNIQCDRCKKIYMESLDTEIRYKAVTYINNGEFHICYECGIVLRDFLEENIPLEKKGTRQIEHENDKKIQDDYFNSLKDV